MPHRHAAVWLDHREAHIIKFGLSGEDREVLRSETKTEHIHHKANSIGPGHAAIDYRFYDGIAKTLEGTAEILIAGPGLAKTELAERIRIHHSAIAKSIVGIEALDHPSEGELLRFAHSFMRSADRMHP